MKLGTARPSGKLARLLATVTIGVVAAVTPSSGDVDSSGDCVRSATLVSVTTILADGSAAPQNATPGQYATRYTYNLDGNILSEVQPPAGWKPITGTDEELRTYGFPRRPTDPAALKLWNQDFSSWKENFTAAMCETAKYSEAFYSHNWAGGFNSNGTTNVNTYFDSQMRFVEPTFNAVCPHASAYSIWSGLGGYNQFKLIQAGTDTGSVLNTAHLFWEMISPQHLNPEVAGPAVSPGDVIKTDAFYDTFSNTADMYAYDVTLGEMFSVGPLSSYAGQAASGYYDGSTSDYITEEPGKSDGTLYNLRQPSALDEYIPWILVNGQALSTYPSASIGQRNPPSPSSPPIQTSSFDGVNGWYDFWDSCT